MTLPGLRGVEHVGITVQDIEAATSFFVNILGCEVVFESGPFPPNPAVNPVRLHIHAEAHIQKLRMLRCGTGANIELLQYHAPDQTGATLRNSDPGSHHLCLYVDDLRTAVDYLQAEGIEVLGDPLTVTAGNNAGLSHVFFRAPFGIYIELFSYPNGRGYEATAPRKLWNPVHPYD